MITNISLSVEVVYPRRCASGDSFGQKSPITLWLFGLFVLVLGGVSPSIAQVPADPNQGLQMWSTQDFGIDLATSAINTKIPLRSKVGAIPFSAYLFGTSQAYESTAGGGAMIYTSSAAGISSYFDPISVGWSGSFPPTVGTCVGGTASYYKYAIYGIYDSTGATHPLRNGLTWTLSTQSNCQSTPSPTTTTDGSGYTFVANSSGSFSIYDHSGMNWNGHCSLSGGPGCYYNSAVVDPDGNTISDSGGGGSGGIGSITDTLGVIALTANVSGGGITSYSYTDPSDTAQVYYSFVNGSAQNIKTNFACQNWNDWSGPGMKFITSLTTPNGGQYGFAYEPTPNGNGFTNTTPPTYFTGRIAKITYPSGGSVSYSYSGGNNGFNCTSGVVPTLTVTLNDNNGNVNTYTYVNSNASAPGGKFTVVKTDPAGNQTLYNFYGEFETQVASYQGGCPTSTTGCAGGGALLTTKTTCYNGNLTNCATPSSAPTLPVKETDVYTSINGSSTNRVQTIYDCNANPNACYGNVVQVSQYDFGANTPTLQKSIYYGQSWNSTTQACNPYPSGSYINNTPCYIVTQNSNNNVAATTIAYSNTGHATSISKLTGGSSYITTTASYNSNGTIAWAKDAAGNQTSFAYNGACNGILPTSVTPAIAALAVSLTWDCNGGVPISYTDANGAVTHFGYQNESSTADAFWRLLSVEDPLGNTTWTDYSPGATLPETMETYLNFPISNPTSTVDVLKTLDGFARVVQSKNRTAPGASTFDSTINYTYGWQSSTGSCTNTPPFATGACTTQSVAGGTGITTIDFDAIGRTLSIKDGGGGTFMHTYSQNDDLAVLGPAPSGENTKQVQNQFDGLGRLTASCVIGNGSSTACAQNTGSANGVTTSSTYSYASGSSTVTTVRGSQTHYVTTDGVGRVIQTSTPEASAAWNYYYDSYSSCPTGYKGATGQLAATKDPNGNLLCYSYDSMNRVTGVNANGTTCRHFYYDNSTGYGGSIPSGVSTPTNPYGRMVEAATDSCSSGSLITDEWFSYNQDGNVTDMWVSTPHSTQYYHSQATFFANGKVNTIQLVSPSLYTMSYTLDGEGRWKTLTDTTASQNIVTSATYFPSANPATINYTGSTPDNDAYTFDSNTGRINKFVFTVGSTPASLTGNLTWNTNGTLGQVSTTDQFNSGNSYNCYSNSSGSLGHGYDDLGRLVEFDCGSGNWGQQYAYDQYDNLTKTVLSGRTGTTWNPGYNQNNNHCTGCTYDNDGNVLSDGSHVYTWNEFAKLKSVATSGSVTCGTNGMCPVYDAFGRMVESSSGSTWTEWWITQGGTESMSGTTGNFGSFPTPGGNTAIVSGSVYVLHNDWLGSARLAHVVSTRNVYMDRGFTPYGETYSNFGSGDGQSRLDRFAGTTDNFDRGVMWDTPNRELSIVGRWLSPDPAMTGWNQFAYATNPNSQIDPMGTRIDNDFPFVPCNVGGSCPQAPWANGGCVNVSLDGGQGLCTWLTGTALDWQQVPIKAMGWVYGPVDTQVLPTETPLPGEAVSAKVVYMGYYFGEIPIGDAWSLFDANNGPTATIGPPSQQYKPAPTGLKKYLTQYVPCAIGEGINQFWGDDDKAAATVLANIAPLAPANLLKGGPWVYVGLAGVYDISNALSVRKTCTQSVYGGG